MRAGVARVCITPPVGTWQGGYGARTRPCEGIHDDLYARALVLGGDDGRPCAAIVSVDVVGLPPELADAARRRAEEATGIPAGHIALCASHTHGGPATRSYVGFSGPQPDADYLRLLEKYLAGVVAAAARDLRPATVRLGRGQAGFNVNRRLRTAQATLMLPNPEGPVDREVLVVRVDAVRADEGQRPKDEPLSAARPLSFIQGNGGAAPLAILFRYTCHATAMGAQNYLITADYPGAAAAFVEQAYGGGTLALFLQGCAGNVRPHLVTRAGGFRSADWAELARLGRELGAATVAAAEAAAPLEARPVSSAGEGARAEGGAPPAHNGGAQPVAAAGKTVLLPFGPPPQEADLRALLATGHWPDGRGLTETERLWARRTLEGLGAGTLPVGNPAEVQVFRLGDVWLVTLPGEVFVEIGWRVREAVAAAAGVSSAGVVVAAYANGSVGYVPTGAAIPEGGYEVTAHRHAGWPACYAPEAEDILVHTAAELAAGLA
jgi:hypothetical protein